VDYNATLTIRPHSPVEDDDAVDDLMNILAGYHPAIGDAPAAPGAIEAVISLPAHTLAQAVTTATALAVQVGDLEGIEVIPTHVWDRREGLKVDDVELVSVTEAAARLGLTGQAVRDRIAAGTLPGRKIGRNWLVPTAALAS
jgi:hypothetical protein